MEDQESCGPATLIGVARFLHNMRRPGRGIPLVAAEALLLIGAGVDSVPELQRVMELNSAGVSRAVSLLRGRARFSQGRVIDSPYEGLVTTRRHPDRRGLQLLLTPEGRELVGLMRPLDAAELAGGTGEAAA